MDITVENIPADEVGATPAQATAPSDTTTHLLLANRFNIDTPTKEEDGKLREIWQYAQSMTDSSDLQEILWQAIHLENTLGAPRLGESRLDKLYRFTKLKRQESQIQRELKDVATNFSVRR